MATADGNKKINRKIGSASRNEYLTCDTPIPMFAAAATNQMLGSHYHRNKNVR
jgi:hypothetical protein